MNGRTPERTCGKKIKHLTEESAAVHQQDFISRGKKAKKNRMDIYLCPFCGFFHVGHKFRMPDPD